MRRTGFTLVEMMIVTFLLAALSAIAMPSIASSIKSSRTRSYLSNIERIAEQANLAAQKTGQTVILTVDEDGSFAFDTNGQDSQGNPASIAVPPIPDIVPNRFQKGPDETSASEWQARFFSDGSSEAAGIEFEGNGDKWYLSIDAHGHATVDRGELPELDVPQSWPAGDYVHRT